MSIANGSVGSQRCFFLQNFKFRWKSWSNPDLNWSQINLENKISEKSWNWVSCVLLFLSHFYEIFYSSQFKFRWKSQANPDLNWSQINPRFYSQKNPETDVNKSFSCSVLSFTHFYYIFYSSQFKFLLFHLFELMQTINVKNPERTLGGQEEETEHTALINSTPEESDYDSKGWYWQAMMVNDVWSF